MSTNQKSSAVPTLSPPPPPKEYQKPGPEQVEAGIDGLVGEAVNALYHAGETIANLSRQRVYNVLLDVACRANEVTEPVKLGLETDAYMVSYKDHTVNWAVLAKGMNDVDPEIIRDEQARAVFTFWREAVNSAVIASFAQSWLGEAELENLQEDIDEYLTTKGK